MTYKPIVPSLRLFDLLPSGPSHEAADVEDDRVAEFVLASSIATLAIAPE